MTARLLIYEHVVPVSRARHGHWSVEVGGDYAFSRKVNSVPLMAVEFPLAAAEYPIVFSGTDAVMPVVVLGVRDASNMYLADDGTRRRRRAASPPPLPPPTPRHRSRPRRRGSRSARGSAVALYPSATLIGS